MLCVVKTKEQARIVETKKLVFVVWSVGRGLDDGLITRREVTYRVYAYLIVRITIHVTKEAV